MKYKPQSAVTISPRTSQNPSKKKFQDLEKKLEKDKDDKNKEGGQGNSKHKPDDRDDSRVVYNNETNHKRWRLQNGQMYSKIFFPFQKNCPKTKEGKQMCMKFLIRGFCVSNCARTHKLTTEDETTFDVFYHKCRDYKEDYKEGASKPDF